MNKQTKKPAKILKQIDKIILDEEYKTLETEVDENIFDIRNYTN